MSETGDCITIPTAEITLRYGTAMPLGYETAVFVLSKRKGIVFASLN